MRVFIWLLALILIIPSALSANDSYETNTCHFFCGYVGFKCCVTGYGSFNHHERYDAEDGSGECWAQCEPAPQPKIPLYPDLAVTKLEARQNTGRWFITAYIENRGNASIELGDKDDIRFLIKQVLQPDLFFPSQQKSFLVNWYSVKDNGPIVFGQGLWLNDVGIPTFSVIPEFPYRYSISINQADFLHEWTKDNNVLNGVVIVHNNGTVYFEPKSI